MDKPKLKLKIGIIGSVFNIIAILLFIFSITFLIINWAELPDKVPTHYNLLGEPDAWGSRGFIIIPLGIGAIIWAGMHILEGFPHLYNYINLTNENVERQYKNSMLMINCLKNEILVYFSLGSMNDVQIALGKANLLGVWEFPIIFFIIFGTLAFFIIRSFKIN